MVNLRRLLPRESFIQFQVRKLANAKLLWLNRELWTSEDDPFTYAMCIPYDNESPTAYQDHTATWWGERYGGAGLAGNGGGVRCGLSENIQIKGVGQNPLAGSTTDHWHKHGAISIQDSVRETLWGEILDAALPHGAIRSLAIFANGTDFQGEVADTHEPVNVSRGLLLRQPALRPAHYMRSIFFSPTLDMFDAVSDVDRTRKAVEGIQLGLSSIWQSDVDCTEKNHIDLNTGFVEVFQRAACQIAASRAKRLIHGSLISSNFSLNGAWLDFGTTSALSDFGRAIVAPGSLDLWSQQVSVIETIRDLHVYLSKYLPKKLTEDLVCCDVLVENFLKHLYERLRVEFLKLTGIPEPMLMQLDVRVQDRLWKAMMSVVAADNNATYLYYGDDRHEMPVRTGRYSLTGVMNKCAVGNGRDHLRHLISEEVSDIALAEEITDSFWLLKSEVLGQMPIALRSNAVTALSVNCIRANWDLGPLYRRNFDGAVDEVTRQPETIDPFIKTFTAYWKGVLADLADGPVSLAPWLTPEFACVNQHLHISDGNGNMDACGVLKLIKTFQISPKDQSCLERNASM